MQNISSIAFLFAFKIFSAHPYVYHLRNIIPIIRVEGGIYNKALLQIAVSFLCTHSILSSQLCPLLHLSFYPKLSGRSGRNCLLSTVLSGYNGSPDTRFSWATTRLMSWPDRERYLPPLQSLVVSLLFSLVSTLVFSRNGGELTHLNSDIHRFPRFPPRNLCSFVMLAVFSLVYTATDTAFC